MLFFVDESGIDRQAAPYVVLACISIQEERAWPLVLAEGELKARFLSSFDPRSTVPHEWQEAKASDLLRRQVFRLAGPRPWLSDERIEALVASARGKRGQRLSPDEVKAASQGNVRFVEELLEKCGAQGVRVFATVTEKSAPEQRERTFLGKDFSYLFQRTFAYLSQQALGRHGILVFDHRDQAFSKRLIGQMHRYFTGTHNGRTAASRMLPVPLFAESHLMPLTQIADIAAYIINWAFRLGPIHAPAREEMLYLGLQVKQLQFEGIRIDRFDQTEKPLWGIQYIADLRPRSEREEDEDAEGGAREGASQQ